MTQQTATIEPGTETHPLQLTLDLCAADMALMDKHIQASLQSDVVLVNQVANYIVSSGGKRLRPMLLLLVARACGYQGKDHVPLAAL